MRYSTGALRKNKTGFYRFYLCYNDRMLNLKEERALFAQGFKLIGGIDEAGRGPLAGPVVAACVLVPSGFRPGNSKFMGINDSKKLTDKKRSALFELIAGEFSYGVGVVDHRTIDRINILEATFLAMKQAIGALKQKGDYYLIDGIFQVPGSAIRQKAIIGGDGLVFSIAAASIMAKVTRDRIMSEMHSEYPQYGFDVHKGYGTKSHLEKLDLHGPCPIHRRSYAPVHERLKSS